MLNLSREAINWIDGELLGDGCLRVPPSMRSPIMGYTSKYSEYIEYISGTLNSFGIVQSGRLYKRQDKTWRNYYYQYSSVSYKELLPIYKRWYPEGKKVVPRDVKLFPLTCRQWYIGDGCLVHSKVRMKLPSIILSTCAFPMYDVEWLVGQLSEIGILATRERAHNTIHISTVSVIDFLTYIGECPVKCYQYKWNYFK